MDAEGLKTDFYVLEENKAQLPAEVPQRGQPWFFCRHHAASPRHDANYACAHGRCSFCQMGWRNNFGSDLFTSVATRRCL